MFGPFRLACEDCSFEDRIASGENAQHAAESHCERNGHAVRITDVNTGAEVEVSD